MFICCLYHHCSYNQSPTATDAVLRCVRYQILLRGDLAGGRGRLWLQGARWKRFLFFRCRKNMGDSGWRIWTHGKTWNLLWICNIYIYIEINNAICDIFQWTLGVAKESEPGTLGIYGWVDLTCKGVTENGALTSYALGFMAVFFYGDNNDWPTDGLWFDGFFSSPEFFRLTHVFLFWDFMGVEWCIWLNASDRWCSLSMEINCPGRYTRVQL